MMHLPLDPASRMLSGTVHMPAMQRGATLPHTPKDGMLEVSPATTGHFDRVPQLPQLLPKLPPAQLPS